MVNNSEKNSLKTPQSTQIYGSYEVLIRFKHVRLLLILLLRY